MFLAPSHSDLGESLLITTLLGIPLGEPDGKTPTKSKTMGIFKSFVKQAQNEFESSVVKVRSDNDTEFRNTQVEELCNDMGIKHEFSSTSTPQQNGVVERKNKTLITFARAMLDDYGISQRFWAEAINTECHASNRIYLHCFLGKTPYELLIGRKPNISYF